MTNTTPNSSEDWEKEFDRCWNYDPSWQIPNPETIKDFIRREIAAAEQTAYTRGKKDTVEYVKKEFEKVNQIENEPGMFNIHKLELAEILNEAALTNPKD